MPLGPTELCCSWYSGKVRSVQAPCTGTERLLELYLFPSPTRVMTRLLDYPEAMVLPWHEVLEPCLNCLSGPNSDSEVPDPRQGLEEGRQKLGRCLLGEALGVQQIFRGPRALWCREEGEKGWCNSPIQTGLALYQPAFVHREVISDKCWLLG